MTSGMCPSENNCAHLETKTVFFIIPFLMCAPLFRLLNILWCQSLTSFHAKLTAAR